MSEDHRSWAAVFDEEVKELRTRPVAAPVGNDRVGIAFSGGGIRSATFGLGVLEALKQRGLLKTLHYLSTVSGGGYIGAWLSASCQRHPEWLDPAANWDASVAHLRRYSNYLSPKVGFFSADTWSMFTVWIRNTMLVQLTVIFVIASVLMLPRPMLELFRHWPDVGNLRWLSIILFLLAVAGVAGNQVVVNSRTKVSILQAKSWTRGLIGAAICAVIAWVYGAFNRFDPFHGGEQHYAVAAPIAGLLVLGAFWLQPTAVKLIGSLWPGDDPPQQINYTQGWAQTVVVLPMMATGYLVAAILWGEAQSGSSEVGLATFSGFGELFTTAWSYWPFPLSVVFMSLWLLSFCSVSSRRDWKGLAAAFGAPFVAVPVLHALLCVIMLVLHRWARMPGTGLWHAFVWGPPFVLYAFSVTIVMLIGMMGRQSSESAREWWSRLGAWLAIYGVAWMVIAVSAVYGPQWVQWVIHEHPWTSITAAGGWAGTVLGGLFAGRSGKTGSATSAQPGPKKRSTVMEIVAAVAPFVFIGGLLIGVATGLDQIITVNSGQSWSSVAAGHVDPSPFLKTSLVVWAACIAGLLIMAARVDINEFSLNAFYRSRLVRCYLGATRFRPGERPRAAHPAQRVVHVEPAALRHVLSIAGSDGRGPRIGLRGDESVRWTLWDADTRPGDFGVGRGGQPEHGLPHLAGRLVSADRLQRPPRLVVSQSAGLGGQISVAALQPALSVQGIVWRRRRQIKVPDDLRRRTLREPGGLRTDTPALPNRDHQRCRMRP